MYNMKNIVSEVKARICSAIADDENVRKILERDEISIEKGDCVFPCLCYRSVSRDFNLIFVGVNVIYDYTNQWLDTDNDPKTSKPIVSHPSVNAEIKIICETDTDKLRFKKLSDNDCRGKELKSNNICTNVDLLADEIIECISKLQGTWFECIKEIKTREGEPSYSVYRRDITFYIYDIHI